MDGDTLNSQKLSDLVVSEIASRLKLDEKSLSSQIAVSIVDKFASFFEKNEEKYSSKKELANLALAVKENTNKLKDSSKTQNKSESTTFFDNLKKIPEVIDKKVADSAKNAAYKLVPDFLKNVVNDLVPKEQEEAAPFSEEEVTTEGRKSALEHEASSEFAVKSFGESAISQLSDNFPDWIDEGTKKQTEALEKIQKAVEKMPEMLKSIKEAISDIETNGSGGPGVPGGARTAWNAGKAAATGLGTWATTPIASMGTAGAVATTAAGVVGGEIIGGMAGKAIGSNETVSEALYGSKKAGSESYAKYGTGITGFSKGAYDYAFGEGAETRKQTAETEAKTAEMQKAGETKAQKAEELVKSLGFKSLDEFKEQIKAGKTKPLKFNKEKEEWSVNENAQWNPDKQKWDLTSKKSDNPQVPAIVPEPVKEAVKEAVEEVKQEEIPTINVIKPNPNKTSSIQEAIKSEPIVSPEEATSIQNNVAKQAAQVVNTEPKYLTASLNGGIVASAAKSEMANASESKQKDKSPSTQFFDRVKKIPSIIDNKIANKTKDFAFSLIPESVKSFASKFTDSSEDSKKEKDSNTEDVSDESSTEGRKSALEKEKKQEGGVLINSFSETALSDLSARFPNWIEEGTKKQTEILEKIQKTIDKMPDILKDLKDSIEDSAGASGGGLISNALDLVGGDKRKSRTRRSRVRRPKTKIGRALNAVQRRVTGLGSRGPIKSLTSAAGRTTGKIADSAKYLKGAVKGLGAGAKVLGVAGAVLGAGMEFSSRKEEGQSNLQAGVGTAGGAAGAVAGAVIGQALIPIPVVGALIGGAVGGWLGGKIADAATGANDPVELWKNRVSKLENGKKYVEAFEKLPKEPKKVIAEGLKSATEKESEAPGQIAAVDQQIVDQLDRVISFDEEEKKKKDAQVKPSEVKPKAEDRKEETTEPKANVPAIVPEGVKDVAAVSKEKSLVIGTTGETTRAVAKTGIGQALSTIPVVGALNSGAALIKGAAEVSSDQTNKKVSETVIEGKNVSDVSAKEIPSIVPEGVKNKVEGKEIKVPEWVPSDEESQQKYKDIHSRIQDQKQKLQEEITSKNNQKSISATPAQTTNNFSETKTEKLDDKTLQEISKNTKLTNEALAGLAGGVQALAKAIGQMSGESGKPPVIINAGNQNPPNTMRNQADPTSTQFASLGNDIISSFRRGVEASRFTPA